MKRMTAFVICMGVVLHTSFSLAEQWKVFKSHQGHVLNYPPDWVAADGASHTLWDNLEGPGAKIQVIPYPLEYTDWYGTVGTLDEFVEKVVLPDVKPTYRYMSDSAVVPRKEKIQINHKDCVVLTYAVPRDESDYGFPMHKFYALIDDSIGVRMGYVLIVYANSASLRIAEKVEASFRPTNDPALRKALQKEVKR